MQHAALDRIGTDATILQNVETAATLLLHLLFDPAADADRIDLDAHSDRPVAVEWERVPHRNIGRVLVLGEIVIVVAHATGCKVGRLLEKLDDDRGARNG